MNKERVFFIMVNLPLAVIISCSRCGRIWKRNTYERFSTEDLLKGERREKELINKLKKEIWKGQKFKRRRDERWPGFAKGNQK